MIARPLPASSTHTEVKAMPAGRVCTAHHVVVAAAVQGAAGPCWCSDGGSELRAEQQLQHAGHACHAAIAT